jgi:hypothetical protein
MTRILQIPLSAGAVVASFLRTAKLSERAGKMDQLKISVTEEKVCYRLTR